MAENPHYKDLLQRLNEFELRYLIVGGYAIMKYTEPRFTKDLDIWVENSAENSARACEALKKFGAPLESDKITLKRLHETASPIKSVSRQFGSTFSLASLALNSEQRGGDRVEGTIFGVPVHFISLSS